MAAKSAATGEPQRSSARQRAKERAHKESTVSLKATWFRDRLRKKTKQGFQGYPVATVTYYGPNDKHASKVSMGITLEDGGGVGHDAPDANTGSRRREAIWRESKCAIVRIE